MVRDPVTRFSRNHEKIMISKDEPMAFEQINSLTEKIYEQTQSCSPLEIVKTLKVNGQITLKSNNIQRTPTSLFQNLLQSNSNQDSVVWA